MAAPSEPPCAGDHDVDEYGVNGWATAAVAARADREGRPVRVVCVDGASVCGKLGIAAGSALIHVRGDKVFASEIFRGV